MSLHAKHKGEYLVEDICSLFGRSKQAYYKYDESKVMERIAKEIFAVEYIREVRAKDHGIGGVKLWYMYKNRFSGSSLLGRDLFEDVIYKNGLKIRMKVRKPRTTDSTHGLPTYPNLIKDFIPTAANQLWVSDITYIVMITDSTHYKFCYLSLIMDAYTEEIKGYSVGETLDSRYPIEALRMALASLDGKDLQGLKLIHHSDRGCQYASNEYVRILQANGILISMTEDGNPKDNPQAERINSTMKNELLYGLIFHDISQVKAAIEIAVKFYNTERPHMSIDMMTPKEAERYTGNIQKRWYSFRDNAIRNKNLNHITENGLPLQRS